MTNEPGSICTQKLRTNGKKISGTTVCINKICYSGKIQKRQAGMQAFLQRGGGLCQRQDLHVAHPVGFAIKLPEESRNVLMRCKGTKPLRYFSKGPIKKDYVVVPQTMLDDMKTLRRWVHASITYALSLPRPVRKKRKLSDRNK